MTPNTFVRRAWLALPMVLLLFACGGPDAGEQPDLATAPGADTAADASVDAPSDPPADLAAPMDLRQPADLTVCSGPGQACGCCDQSKAADAGYFGSWCAPSTQTCAGCGTKAGDPCCDRPETFGLGRCKTSGIVLSCRANVCEACGNLGQATCTSGAACNPPWKDEHGYCM